LATAQRAAGNDVLLVWPRNKSVEVTDSILQSPALPGFTWTFNRFSDCAAQVQEARIWAGIHYRNSCNVGSTMGHALAAYVLTHALPSVK
jgi:hypothetical protein